MWISRYTPCAIGAIAPSEAQRNPAVVTAILSILVFAVPLAAIGLLDVLLGQIFWQTWRRPIARRERRLDEPTYPDTNGPSLL